MKIAIIGASKDKEKFSNKAVRAYKKNHHVVFPVNPNEREIEGLKCYNSVMSIPLDVEVASFYLPPAVGEKIIDEVIKKGIKKVFLNPGTESDEIIKKLKSAKIEIVQTCSILDIGEDPEKL
ncbi:CoA-binding protein [archaeon]|jgi:uncharacterized protein|nr:CoA-binding protein [archaeon]MBT4022431.1 CoA-binding protein [archaeon]MBT4272585.1 CoA-binding protein [archaeon]MBT4461248.1 CoA-binding protein [archaeon]MBT4858544.1 CoA-binding protein [archaeon]